MGASGMEFANLTVSPTSNTSNDVSRVFLQPPFIPFLFPYLQESPQLAGLMESEYFTHRRDESAGTTVEEIIRQDQTKACNASRSRSAPSWC
jgi:hypothetical protein